MTCLLCGPSRAAEPEYSDAYKACSAKAASTMEMTDCADTEWALWEKKLNAAYQSAIEAQEPGKALESLKEAQRSWVRYREANCDYYSNLQGTISKIYFSDCRLFMTAQRAQELKDMQEK